MLSTTAQAMDYDVDMPNSGDPKFQMVRVVIDGCETKFKIKNEDFNKFSKNDEAMDQLIQKAIQHSKSGCAKN
jgi:hypothetical protein